MCRACRFGEWCIQYDIQSGLKGQNMDERTEIDGKYQIGSHWRTIQRSLFPEWEREEGLKAAEEERCRRDEGRNAGCVSR